MDWALLATSVALAVLTAALVYYTWGLVDEARKTRAEMQATRHEMEEARRLGVRPHLVLEPVMIGPVYASLGIRNVGPGSARNVALAIEFEPLGDVRDLATPVIPPGHAEQFFLPDTVKDLQGAQAADLVSHVTGSMEDVYGERLAIDLAFEWAPWVEKLTDAGRRWQEEPTRTLEKALEKIEKAIDKGAKALARRA